MKPPETTTTRSAIMRAVRARDTSPELAVRRLLRPMAPGYRLHRKDIPGRPDIAYIGAKRAIFVHGCFWHGHECARGARAPKTNADYWRAKIARNKARDAGAAAPALSTRAPESTNPFKRGPAPPPPEDNDA